MGNLENTISSIRDFNRFYTSVIGLLDKHILDSPYSLAEARVMYEINQATNCTARHIMAETKMDEGYLSRTIQRLLKLGLLEKKKSEADGRAFLLSLTAKGKKEFTLLDKASHDDIAALLCKLTHSELEMLSTQLTIAKTILQKTI